MMLASTPPVRPAPPAVGDAPVRLLRGQGRALAICEQFPSGPCTSAGAAGKTMRLDRFFAKFNRQLEDNAFVAGPRFTVADATALCAVDFAGWSDVTLPAGRSHLRRWHDAVSARPSVKA